MSDDTELLRRYVEERSESAFAELVREHLNLVYSAAFREMNGDGALAEEISQVVFTELARRSPQLLGHPSLAGWLYIAVRNQAANTRRAEHRRRRREEDAQAMNCLVSEDASDLAWQEIRPVLDDALHELKESDRTAIVLRFLENRNLHDVGTALGLQENAARMRVERALEKLRGLLARRGITSTASGLTAALAIGVVTPAPEALAVTITSAALSSGAAASSTALTLLKLMSMTKIKVSLVGAVVVAGIAVPAWQQARLHRVQSENAQLRAQETDVRTQETELTALRGEVERLRKVGTNQAELVRLREWQAQTEPELLRLRGMAGAARRASVEAEQLRAQLARQGGEPSTNLVAGAMVEGMKQAMDLELEGRLGRMTNSLRLTPEQTQAARDILERQAQVMKRLFAGNFKPEETTGPGSEAVSGEEQIQALLTPEQKAAYAGFQQEEAARNARLAANTELLQMVSPLNLTSEQEDRAFAALYELSLNQLTGRSTPPAVSQSEAMQAYLDQKAKALETVLTPAQMEKYRQQQAVQAKLAQDVVRKMEEAAGPSGPSKANQ